MRTDVTFTSGGDTCAAWFYEPEHATATAPCVVMAHGLSMTRHDGLAPFAERFAAAGLAVLVFDHRHLGDSGGMRRQRFRRQEQLEDWRNAVACAGRRTEVDAKRIVLWGFSFSAGHVVTLAARELTPAAAIVLCPFVDGFRRVLATPPSLVAWILPRAILDLAGRHTTIPVTAPPGGKGAMTLQGEADGFARAVPAGSPWRNELSPGLFATVAFYRPVARAKQIGCPLWVGLGDRDVTVDGGAVQRLAERAPRGELHRYPYDHFDPFVGDAPAAIAEDQIAFLARQGLVAAPERAAA